MKNMMKSSKMAKKASALKGFMNSMSMKKGRLKSVDAEKNPGLAKLPTEVRNKMGYMKKGGMKKGGMGMNIMDEAMDNATPSIPNSYYAMGGMKEMNPLASMIKKKSTKKAGMKPKMAMGGMPPNAFGLGVQPLMASKYQKDTLMGQSFKKGGKVKKK